MNQSESKSAKETKADGLHHEEKMPLKERIEESQAYGEKYRAEHAGADIREAVKPLHTDKKKTELPLKERDLDNR